MREIDNFLHKESAKLYQLLRDVQENRKVQDKVWEDFCKKTNDDSSNKKSYFKKHPKHISSSSSEVLSPRGNLVAQNTKPRLLKHHPWKPPINSDELQKSQSSLDMVTVRQEINVIRNGYFKKVCSPPMWGDGEKKDLDSRQTKGRAKSSDVPRGSSQKKVSICEKKQMLKKHVVEKNEKPRDVISEVNVETKLNYVVDKTLKCMEDIRMQIDAGVMSLDGDDDMDRRRKRSVEFASRFSRNYLYQLNRQVNDILQITSQFGGNLTHRTVYCIRQKLVASYQTLLQGLQAYYNHIPVSTTNAVPDKVRELLKLTSSLCEIHRNCVNKDLNSNFEKDKIIDVFEVRSRCLLEKINERFFYPSSSSLMQVNNPCDVYQSRERGSNKKKYNMPRNRYAMYTSAPIRQDEAWKKACAVLARKKLNVASKYKTANFKHRPPVDKQAVVPKQLQKGIKVVEKKSSARMKLKSALNDDNIQTIVQLHTDKESDVCLNSSEQLTKNANTISNASAQVQSADEKHDMLANLIGQVVNTIAEENKEMNQQQVKNILLSLLECVGGKDLQEKVQTERKPEEERNATEEEPKVTEEEQKKLKWTNAEGFDNLLLKKAVDVLKRNQESLKKAKEVCEKNTAKEDVEEKKKPDRKKSITVTGVKNAQLICIKDEDSLVEPSSDDEKKPTVEVKREPSRHSSSHSRDQIKNVETKPITSEVHIQRNSAERVSKIKISRLPRGPLRPLKMLPKKSALDILEYKINYVKARKGNHMYKKSATKQPWVLMGEIADKILDELIQAVGSEIQVNGVIDSIYASEFAQ